MWPPAKRAEAERVYTGWLNEYRSLVQAKGAPLNDVARAASYLIASIAYIEQGGRDLTPAQLQPMRRQMHDLYAGSEWFRRMPDSQRQELYEMYVIQATMLTDQFQGAQERKDAKLLAHVHQINRRWSLNLLNAPLEKVRFTDAGIVIG